MSTSDITSTPQRDVYRKVADAIINNRARCENLADAVAHLRAIRFLAY